MCKSSSDGGSAWGVAWSWDAGAAQRMVVMQASGFTRMQVALSVMKPPFHWSC